MHVNACMCACVSIYAFTSFPKSNGLYFLQVVCLTVCNAFLHLHNTQATDGKQGSGK